VPWPASDAGQARRQQESLRQGPDSETMGKSRELVIAGKYEHVMEACQFIAAGARSVGFDAGEVFHIELACDEACTNVIQHAYGGEGKGDIRVSWDMSNGAFTIVIRDKGREFDPDSVPQPHIPDGPDDIDSLRIGGLGIHFMRTLMDRVTFTFEAGKGNKLVMIKNLPRDENR
jgi:serine/threonine-protein kinase RsbW